MKKVPDQGGVPRGIETAAIGAKRGRQVTTLEFEKEEDYGCI